MHIIKRNYRLWKHFGLATLCLMLSALGWDAQAALSGTYTINPGASASSSNYTSFKDAVGDLLNGSRSSGTANGPGVSGAVTFNVSKGTYYEKLEITQITGVSATKNVTFKSSSGANADVTLVDTNTSTFGSNYTIYLNGADFLTFKDMTIGRWSKTQTLTYGTVIKIENNADSNNFVGNNIVGFPSTSSYAALVVSQDYPYANDSFNTFRNNHFKYGSYSVYNYGNYSTRESHWTFENNIFDSAYYYGLYTYYMKDYVVKGNLFRNFTYQYGYATLCYYGENVDISGNTVNFPNGGYGFMVYYNYGDASHPTRIYNNMITMSGYAFAGIYGYGNDYLEVYYNNIALYPSSALSGSYTYALFLSGSSSDETYVYNNNAANFGTGTYHYALYSYYNALTEEDHNNLYNGGGNLVYHDYTNYTDLPDWKTNNSSGFGAKDTFVDPGYYSSSDLHVTNVALNGQAKAFTTYTKDFDGETRNTSTPDIGADEWAPAANQAGIMSIDSPALGFCSGTKDVYVRLRNFGTATLTSATIGWKVNGTAKTSYSWTGSLSPGLSASVKIGSHTFATGTPVYNIVAYASSPNGATVAGARTDTAKAAVRLALNGTYTIGGSSPDFANFTAAVNALKAGGICGPVVFNVRDGKYTEQISIPEIAGASSTNRIIFQSQSLDSTKVHLYSPGSTTSNVNNYTVQLDGADYITFRKMTISRTSASGASYSQVVELKGGAHNNRFISNRLISDKNALYNAVLASSSDQDTGLLVENNLVKYGYYGIYLYGNYSAFETNNIVRGNTIDSAYYYGMISYYQSGVLITENTISNTQYYYGYGLYSYYSGDATKITKNKVLLNNSGYGMYVYYSIGSYINGSGSDTVLIANNFIRVGTGSGPGYGMMVYYSDGVNIYHNNVLISQTGQYTYAGYIYHYTSSEIYVKNNNWINKGGGYAFYGTTTSIMESDYNNFYTTGSSMTPNDPTLSDWQSSTSFDANSKDVDPLFASATDLHINNSSLLGAGVNVGVKVDIDGESRPAKPSIGADDFTPLPNDAALKSIDSPSLGFCSGTRDIWVRLSNVASNTLTSVTIGWSVNGTAQTSYSWTGSLSSNTDALVKIGSLTFTSGSAKNVKVWTSNPNGTTDPRRKNDTAFRVVQPSLNGTYTIGGTGANYASFNDAVTALNTYGVCGPVTFNVSDGSYNEQVKVGVIVGASAANRVVFQSKNLDSTKVKLWHASSSSNTNDYVLEFNGASHVTFRKMTIQRTGNTAYYYGGVVSVRGGSHKVSVENNRILSLSSVYTYSPVVYSQADQDSFVTVRNNLVRGGYYGILFSASYAAPESGLVIAENTVDSAYYYGVLLQYQSAPVVEKNTIGKFVYTYPYGLYTYYVTERALIQKNRIEVQGGYGMYLYYTNGGSDTVQVVNNFVSGNAANYGILSYYSDYVNFYHNNVLLKSTGYAGYFYHYTTANVFVKNNNWTNYGTGYAFYGSTTSIMESDYNNFYTKGSNLFGSYSTLSGWQGATSFDANSKDIDPQYNSNTDLHISASGLFGAGVNVGVKDDIDDDKRPAKPSIGADDFTPLPNDAAIASIDSPGVTFCSGTQSVYARLQNVASNNLTSATIRWRIDGVAQTAVSWTGTLAPNASALVKLGSISFSGKTPKILIARVFNPNGTTDPRPKNDSVVRSIRPSLSGAFTIGGASPDFKTFAAAVSALDSYGVCGPVTFNVRNGSYNEQISIKKINGASAANPVIFQSQSLDSTKVTLWYVSSSSFSSNNYTLQFNGAGYVTFRKMTIQRTGTTYTYAAAVDIRGNSGNITLESNRILCPNGYTYNAAPVFSSQDQDSFITVRNNVLRNGYYSIYLYGPYGSFETGNVIEGNIIDSAYNYGIYTYYQSGIRIESNTLRNVQYAGYGIYLYYAYDGTKVLKNKVIMPNGGYGIYMYYTIGNMTDTALIANNFVAINGTTSTYTGYGIMGYYSDYVNVYHNNVNQKVPYSSTYAGYFYHYTTSNVFIKNNNWVNTGGGYAFYGTTTSIMESDYNNFYTSGSNLFPSYSTLSGWQGATSFDANSKNVDPKYASATDLHISATSLFGAGTGVGIKEDIDGDKRSASKPSIGADDIQPMTNDAAIASIDSPATTACSGTQNVYARLSNPGISTITSATLKWWVNGVAQTSVSWTGTLASGGGNTLVKMGSISVTGTPKLIIVKVTNPNGTTDPRKANDSAMISVRSALSGTYTIGSGSGTSFKTFKAAAAALDSAGVCGPVVFNVQNGTYNEQVTIKNIKGASSINTVTFQSTARNFTKVTLTYAASSSSTNDFALQFSGAGYVTFRDMTIRRTGSTYTYASAVEISGGSHHITLNKNHIYGVAGYTYSYTVRSTADVDSFITIRDNHIQHGYGSILLQGGYNGAESGNVIERNAIDSAYYYGIYATYQRAPRIDSNQITDIQYYYGYGLYSYYMYDAGRVTRNKIDMTNSGYGIYMYYTMGTMTDTCLLANNMISVQQGTYTTTGYGLISYYSDYLNVYHNNVLIENTYTSSYAGYFYHYTTANVFVKNNNWVNNGGGYTIYGSTTAIMESDYNNFYTTGGTFSGSYGSLSAWQSSTSFDANSQELDPQYKGSDDLHINNRSLNRLGTPVGITIDFDGQKRSLSKPSIGADEFPPVPNDASIISVDSPGLAFCAGTHDIWARLANYGTNTLTSATIRWSVNGTTQTAVSWTGTLASNTDVLVKIASRSFASGSTTNIKFWATGLNGTSAVGADTFNRDMRPALSGTFTLGGSSPDYATFREAADALNKGGVCGPVIINVRDGYYEETVSFGRINGASSINTITFQSQSRDSSLVKLDTSSSSSFSDPNYTLQFNGAGYITFRDMTISRNGTGYYANVVDIRGGAHHVTLNNNILAGITNYGNVVNSSQDLDSAITIRQNNIKFGYYGIYLYHYAYPATFEPGNRIEHNILDSNYYSGMYVYYQDGINVEGNEIGNLQYAFGGTYGIYTYYFVNASKIHRNRINLDNGGYGLMIYYANGMNDSVLVANNFITMQGSNFATGIYSYGSDLTNFYHNSIHVLNSSSSSYGMYMINYSSPTSLQVYNNIVYNVGNSSSPYCIYNYGAITNSDYNDFYSPNGYVGYYSGSQTTLSDWQSATGWDANSVSADPAFFSATDLHTRSGNVNGRGTVLGSVTSDIDGQSRSTMAPDLGADEFTPLAHDVAVAAIVSPMGANCGDSAVNIVVKVSNIGGNTESRIPVIVKAYNLATGGVTTITDSLVYTTGGLAPARDSLLVMSKTVRLNTWNGGDYIIDARTAMLGDLDTANDDVWTAVSFRRHLRTPSVTPAFTCSGSTSLTLRANGGTDSLFWYDAATGGTLVGQGKTFKTPTLTSTKVYYVEAAPNIDSVGELDNSFGTAYNYSPGTNPYGLTFDANDTTIIDSVTIFPSTSGTVVINIEDNSGNTIYTNSFSVTASSGSPVVLPIKATIPTGTDYVIHAAGTSVALSYNYTSGTSYTYSGGNIDITGPSNIASSNYYFFFYNWILTDKDACPSFRMPVPAVIGTGGKPTASFTATSGCMGKAASFKDNSTVPSGGSIASVGYDFGDGTVGASTAGGTATHTYTKAGTYRVRQAVQTAGGCVDTTSKWVKVSPSPLAGFQTRNVCDGTTATFTDTSIVPTGMSANQKWYYGNGNSGTANSFKYSAPGTYTVSLVITGSGCSDSTTRTVTVNPNPVAKFGVTNLCGGPVQFVDSSTTASGTLRKYQWTFGDGGKDTTRGNTSHSYTTNGTYTASLSVENSFGCANTVLAFRSVTIAPLADTGIKVNYLGSGKYQFAALDSVKATSYTWDFGDLNTGTGRVAQHGYAANGTYTIVLQLANVNGCITYDSISYTVTNTGDLADVPGLNSFGVAPNPFRGKTTISYGLASREFVKVEVVDLLGRRVALLEEGTKPAGTYSVPFTADNFNANLGGVFFVKMTIGDKVLLREVISLKE